MTASEPDRHPPPASASPGEAHRSLNLMRLLRLCRKELRETLRDRRTIVTLFLMPLLAYPLLSMAFQRLLLTADPTNSSPRCRVAVADPRSARRLERLLGFGDALVRAAEGQPPTGGEPPSPPPQEPTLELVTVEDIESSVADGDADVGVYVELLDAPPLIRGLGRPARVELVLRENSLLSRLGADFILRRLRLLNERYTHDRLVELGAPPFQPTTIRQREIAVSSTAFSLTAFVPLILILMTITGAVYPAIDLTAGERERGTLETLMAAPVPRFGLLFAKYIAVVTVALLTATANLVAMSVTLIATGLGPVIFGPHGPTLALIDQVFILLMLFAAFFSAILLAVTSFARSFKEAQAYLIPLMLVTIAPGVMSLMPDLEFNGLLAVTPLVNIVLLARDLLEGSPDLPLAGVAVVSTLLYAVAAISLAARIFGTDAVLYGSQATWSDLLRRAERTSQTPSVAGAMLCLAVVYPAYFLLAGSLGQLSSAGISTRLILSALVTGVLFLGLPLIAATLQRARWSSTFQGRWPGTVAMLAGVLLGLTLWPLAHEVYLLNELLGLRTLGQQQIEAVEQLLDSWRSISPWIILLTLALTPAVCEELFFRGYLLSALRGSMPSAAAVAVTALLFGTFHVITSGALAAERFLPSTFLGLILGWVCVRSGSVLPGILLHALHNGLLLMVAYYRDELQAMGWGVDQQTHLPPSWLAAAGIGTAVGLALIFVTGRFRVPSDAEGGTTAFDRND